MILNTTTKSIEVLLGEAITTSNCDVTASYGDYAGSLFLPGASDTVTNGVTAVTVVAAPTASVQRLCNELTVHNNDTVTHRVIVRLNNSGTFRIFRQSDVPPGGDLIYAPGDGGVTEVEPAILLESGTIGAKISALPLFSLNAPPDGSEKSPVVEAAATTAITLAQSYRLTTNWLHYVATNPLDAATVTSAGQDVQIVAGAGGATSGAGGMVAITSGAGSAGSGDSGTVIVASGAAAAGASGFAELLSGNVTGSGASGEVDCGSGTTDGGTSGVVFLFSGDSATGDTGVVSVTSGNAAAGSSGNAGLASGNASGAGKKSGDILISVGNVAGGATRGLIIIAGLPTVAPVTSGAIWRDIGAGDVLKIVP